MSRFFAGLLAGLAIAAVFSWISSSPPPAPSKPAPDGALRAARAEAERLAARVAELEKRPAEASPRPAAPTSPTAPEVKLEERFEALVEKGLAGMAGPDMRAFLDEVKAKGAPAVAFLVARLRDGSTSQERFLAAAALEGAGDPAAVPALAEALRKDPDDLVRRMASHAIAVIGSDAGEAALRVAMGGDKDWGVRVNSAYGLAKLGRDDGLRMLEGAYGSAETPAEYRLAILGGLADVAAPATAPLFRRILADTTDVSYLLTAVNALGKMKDAGARADLERLAATEGIPQSVREAARKVLAGLPR
ncbi:MAG TPA: HEAT repeat domain-containing protein [Planctomycetota bacterium]